MFYSNYTEEMLGLKDAIVKKIKENEENTTLFIEMKLQTQKCPHCSMHTRRVHDYRNQMIKDLPMFGKPTKVILRKRRYYCPSCKKSFNERLTFLPRYQRMTSRLLAKVLEEFRNICSIKSVASRYKLSQATVTRKLDHISYANTTLPETLSIDEFKGNTGGHKYQTILTNPKKHQVIDILASRKAEDLYRYFTKYPLDFRNNVKYVVMDMSQAFFSTMKTSFPKAEIVVDKFHVHRHITWAFESIRKEEQKKYSDFRRKYFKRSRWIMLKKKEKLTKDELAQLENMLQISERLRKAYQLKDNFQKFMNSKTKEEAVESLKEWYLFVGVSDLPEFNRCLETITRWQPYILNAFKSGLTNGYTEGVNNKIKVIKRISFGVRNFDRFRNRILHAMS